MSANPMGSGAFDHRFLSPEQAKYFPATVGCYRLGCPHRRRDAYVAFFVTTYRYRIGRHGGRINTRVQHWCREHAEEFATKHNLSLPQ